MPADFGDGGGDCTNFASQVMRAGGFHDVGDGLDDWHRGDIDDYKDANGQINHTAVYVGLPWFSPHESRIIGVIAIPSGMGGCWAEPSLVVEQ